MSVTLTLEILTPERKRSIQGITMMTLQLVDGSIGILPGHSPLVAQTITAPLVYKTVNSEVEEKINLDSGILQVKNDRVTIFIAGVPTEDHPLTGRLMKEGLAKLAAVGEPNGKE